MIGTSWIREHPPVFHSQDYHRCWVTEREYWLVKRVADFALLFQDEFEIHKGSTNHSTYLEDKKNWKIKHINTNDEDDDRRCHCNGNEKDIRLYSSDPCHYILVYALSPASRQQEAVYMQDTVEPHLQSNCKRTKRKSKSTQCLKKPASCTPIYRLLCSTLKLVKAPSLENYKRRYGVQSQTCFHSLKVHREEILDCPSWTIEQIHHKETESAIKFCITTIWLLRRSHVEFRRQQKERHKRWCLPSLIA